MKQLSGWKITNLACDEIGGISSPYVVYHHHLFFMREFSYLYRNLNSLSTLNTLLTVLPIPLAQLANFSEIGQISGVLNTMIHDF